MGPTRHPSAFRLNKKELAETEEAATQEEAEALAQGLPAEEAQALTRQKPEKRWKWSQGNTLPVATPLTVILTRLTLQSCKKSLWTHSPENRRNNPSIYGNLRNQFPKRPPQEPAKLREPALLRHQGIENSLAAPHRRLWSHGRPLAAPETYQPTTPTTTTW